MDKSQVKYSYNFKGGYRVDVMKNGDFEVVNSYNQIMFTTYSFEKARQKAVLLGN